MPSLTIKGIPNTLLDLLRRRAELHRRSLNSEVLHLLERSVSSTPVDSEAILRRIRALRERTQLPALSSEDLESAIDAGRP